MAIKQKVDSLQADLEIHYLSIKKKQLLIQNTASKCSKQTTVHVEDIYQFIFYKSFQQTEKGNLIREVQVGRLCWKLQWAMCC